MITRDYIRIAEVIAKINGTIKSDSKLSLSKALSTPVSALGGLVSIEIWIIVLIKFTFSQTIVK